MIKNINEQITVQLPDSRSKFFYESIDGQFAMGVSTICNHFICHSMSFMVLWQPWYHFPVLSLLLLPCSVITHLYISFTI